MYSDYERSREEDLKKQGYKPRAEAYEDWKNQNPNASYSRQKRAKWCLKNNVSNNSGLLMKPEDFG